MVVRILKGHYFLNEFGDTQFFVDLPLSYDKLRHLNYVTILSNDANQLRIKEKMLKSGSRFSDTRIRIP